MKKKNLKYHRLKEDSKYFSYLEDWKKQPLIVEEYLERQRNSSYELSPTEILIMKLCYEGLNNQEIGLQIDLSPRTIDTYISKLIEKLGLRNKIDLIRFCVEHGYYNSRS